MSGIAVIYDGRRAGVTERDLEPLLAAIYHRGPERDVWLGRGIAMGRRLLATTPEARGERLPIEVAGGRYQVALDGRLDNRDDLIDSLALRADARALTDADLVALAYERWGTESFKRLVGDFAFVLWDDPGDRLFAVRDQRGFRPLVYARHTRRLILGSEPQQLFAHPDISGAVDSLSLARHLTGAGQAPGATPYASISEVPAGHYLIARGDQIVLHEYWRFGSRPLIEHRSREEYVEEFEEIFGRAMKAATRTTAPPAVLLSGGLDSSYVAARAVELDPAVSALHAYVPDTKAMDERSHAHAVAERLSMTTREVDVSDCWSLSMDYLPKAAFDQPNLPMQAALMLRMAQAARQSGTNVLIDGIGGDETMDGPGDYLSDLILRGRWRYGAAEVDAWARRVGISRSRVVLKAGLRPMVPPGIRTWMRTRRGKRPPDPLPPWIDRKALDVAGLAAASRIEEPAASWQHEKSSRQFWTFHESEALPVFGWRERHAGLGYGVEARSPFWDLRVLEYILRVPSWVDRSAGRPKALLRAAMRPRLPLDVVERGDKGTFDEVMNVGLVDAERERVALALREGPLSRLLYVKPQVLEGEMELYWSNAHGWWHALWRAVTAGLWLAYGREQWDGLVSDQTDAERKLPQTDAGTIRRRSSPATAPSPI